MSMDEAWSFLKSRAGFWESEAGERLRQKLAGNSDRQGQTKLHDWGAMPKPLGEMTQSFAPQGDRAAKRGLRERNLGGIPYRALGPGNQYQTADFHDLVPLGDAPPKPPPETTESKREHLMGLKPSQFHLTSTRSHRGSPTPLQGDPLEEDRLEHIHESPLDRAYRNIKHYRDNYDFEGTGDIGDLDEMIGEMMESHFGEKTYALHVPKEALPSDYDHSRSIGDVIDEYTLSNIIKPHEKHLSDKVPVSYATMQGPHVSYIYTQPQLRGMGLGRLLGEQILGREGGLVSALRTEYGQGLANKFLSLLGTKRGSAVARKLGRLPRHAEIGPLHNMQGKDPDHMHTSISHGHLPEKWGSLRPDISTVPYSEALSHKLTNAPRQLSWDDPSRSGSYGEWPSTEHTAGRGQTRLTPEGRVDDPPYWKIGWDEQQDRLAQEAWDKMGDPGSGWNGDTPSNWRTNRQIPWYMRHLFREDEFHGNEPEQINEPSDYAYDPENGTV